jgi:NADH-quinone oxidoreductase subunit A
MPEARVVAENQLAPYLPVLLQLVVAGLIAMGMIILSALLGKKKFSRVKMQAYECGITPTGDAQHRFSVKFYMVGMLFILFDVEAIFLIPWAVIYRDLPKLTGSKWFGFSEMIVYIAIVLVGFFYVWKKGVLDWNRPEETERSAAELRATAPSDEFQREAVRG